MIRPNGAKDRSHEWSRSRIATELVESNSNIQTRPGAGGG
jgi:hypothetical protein